jgi:hypothetical protein
MQDVAPYPSMRKTYEYEPDEKPGELEQVCKALGIRRHPDTLFQVLGPLGLACLVNESGCAS